MLIPGGGEPVQQQEQMVEDGHNDHGSHFYWAHPYMFPVYATVFLGLLGGAVKIYLARRKK